MLRSFLAITIWRSHRVSRPLCFVTRQYTYELCRDSEVFSCVAKASSCHHTLHANHWHCLWKIPPIIAVKSNVTTFIQVLRFVVNIFYCGRVAFTVFKHADIKGVGEDMESGPPTPGVQPPKPRPLLFPYYFSGTPAQNSDFGRPPRPSDPRPFFIKSPTYPRPPDPRAPDPLSWPTKAWGSASRAQSPLTTGPLSWQFPSLRGTTWRNTGRSAWNGSHFEHICVFYVEITNIHRVKLKVSC